jgi:predicted TIM-barrel fold metal-dependent hydrolase
MNIINCHTHVFNRDCVPDKFLPLWLRPIANLLLSKKTSQGLINLVSFFGRKNLSQLIKKFHYFLSIGDLKSQLEIFKVLQGFYPKETKFCVLTMDMEYMGAGKVAKPFETQLLELATLKRDPAYTDLILPFIFIHPERPLLYTLVKKYIESENFTGLKMYPPLGYYPFDKRLDLVLSYAEQYGIPITTHCSRGGVYYKGQIQDLKHPITGKSIPKRKNKYLTDIYTDPENYFFLLKKFPDLKINLAHFGGFDEWEKYLANTIVDEDGEVNWFSKVSDLVRSAPNVYTDVSYTLFNKDLIPLLKIVLQDSTLKNKVLFGSDFYMTEIEESEREFCINLRASLGESDFKLIAEENPSIFLFNNIK